MSSNNANLLYDKFRKEYLKPYLEKDANENPYPHSNIGDIKYAAKYQGKEEEQKLFKLFVLIRDYNNKINYQKRKKLIKEFYTSLDRKYSDQTVDKNMPYPEKVGMCIDRIVSNGIHQIGFWVTGTNFKTYPWMVAGTATVQPTYGDTMANVTELARVNVVTDNGFLDPMNDGWNASGGFVRGTPTGTVSEVAMADTENYGTSKIFDRSVLPLDDRIPHEQNQDAFTLLAFYIITSI